MEFKINRPFMVPPSTIDLLGLTVKEFDLIKRSVGKAPYNPMSSEFYKKLDAVDTELTLGNRR